MGHIFLISARQHCCLKITLHTKERWGERRVKEREIVVLIVLGCCSKENCNFRFSDRNCIFGIISEALLHRPPNCWAQRNSFAESDLTPMDFNEETKPYVLSGWRQGLFCGCPLLVAPCGCTAPLMLSDYTPPMFCLCNFSLLLCTGQSLPHGFF